MSHRLTSGQRVRAAALVEPGISFMRAHDYPLGVARVEHAWQGGPAQNVIDALATYQNDDGGFGNGLEVDIKSAVSNPFAARLAMHVLLDLRDRPDTALTHRLAGWLDTNQHPDGDWHFAPEVYEAPLPPWFAGWTFPSLNPACCVAGLAHRLGIATPAMLERVATLFAERASLEEARSGEFYNVLPYVEYCGSVDVPDAGQWLDAVAGNIASGAESGRYADAGHLLEHAFGGGPALADRIPAEVIANGVDRLMDEVESDGGWPSPYDPAWRPSVTAQHLVLLARLA